MFVRNHVGEDLIASRYGFDESLTENEILVSGGDSTGGSNPSEIVGDDHRSGWQIANSCNRAAHRFSPSLFACLGRLLAVADQGRDALNALDEFAELRWIGGQ